MTRPLRAGFVIDTLAPGAGTENQLLLLFSRFDRARLIPHLACLFDNPELSALPLPGGPPEILNVRKLASPAGWRGARRLREWCRERRLDVLVTFFRDANLLGTLAGRWAGVPVVSSRRNLGRGYWHTGWELAKLRLLDRMTAGFVANAEAIRDSTIEAEGVDPGRIRVIPNAVDAIRFRPGPADRRRFSLSPGPLIGCVSNLRPIKGIDVLIRAVSLLPRDIRLAVAGDGGERGKLEALARELGVAERTHWLGPVREVPELLRCFDLAVLPSRGEGFPNAVLEYLATGVPVVATAVGGVPEALDRGGCGVLVPPGDPRALAAGVAGLLDDPPRGAALARAGRERVEAIYTPETAAKRWEEYLRSVAEGP
jgi:glycosyltransferase involved in cell wall biosynthesis